MKEVHVKSQEELNAIPDDYDGRIYIEFGTDNEPAILNRKFIYTVYASDNSRVSACGNSSVSACGNSTVSASDNSSVYASNNNRVSACGNSSVYASNNSSVSACGNSSVYASNNSSVYASDNSRVYASNNSSVYACGNSSVYASDNSRVSACGNTQVTRYSDYSKIEISGNARIVHYPTNISEYLDFYGISETNGSVKLYKAVHKYENRYFSDHNKDFGYIIGETATADYLTEDTEQDCGHGIHIANVNWCLDYGKDWNDLAILEAEAETDKIIVPRYTQGKVRTLSVKVLREVPLEECGLLGEMLAKRRVQREAAEVSEQESKV